MIALIIAYAVCLKSLQGMLHESFRATRHVHRVTQERLLCHEDAKENIPHSVSDMFKTWVRKLVNQAFVACSTAPDYPGPWRSDIYTQYIFRI